MRNIVFDFDGTIADTSFAICEAMERACIRHGAEYVGDKEFSTYIGQDLNVCIAKATTQVLTKEQIDGVARSYRETFKFDLVKPFVGIVEVLQECKANGDKLSIASSRHIDSLTELLEMNDLAKYFEFVVSGDQVENAKPNPEMLYEIADKYKCDAKELIFVGDTKWDMQMAISSGATGLGVTWGSHDSGLLRDAGATFTFDSTEDLQKHFATNC